ncbi:MAG: YeeE/YedE family protein [Bdellovibrionaceae bacterium]|nr:YeeE/YedE family protein [Pseudobdellovibrionaceae bacterium]MDW8190499.1 YeeE/YedE family protein [Pseudobdellovibrionaceae bacterium]
MTKSNNPVNENKEALAAGIAGLIFGIGLVVAGMTQPHKVIGFLDLFGSWDPTLMFVMGGALGLHLVTYRLVRKRNTPLLSPQWHVPTKTEITKPLIIGSFLFGVGWGIAGFCPGPAVVSLASLEGKVIAFVIAMFLGQWLFKVVDAKVKFNR